MRRRSKQDEIAELLGDVFGPGDYAEVAANFASWDMGSPRGVLAWLRQYQCEGKLPREEKPVPDPDIDIITDHPPVNPDPPVNTPPPC